jgi:hypothetical protein
MRGGRVLEGEGQGISSSTQYLVPEYLYLVRPIQRATLVQEWFKGVRVVETRPRVAFNDSDPLEAF